MKRAFLTIAVLFFVMMSVSTYSLTNFNYRGVAFNGTGQALPNTTLNVTVTISNTAGVLYQETHSNVTTDQFAVYTVEVGTGTVNSGAMAGITLTADTRIKLEAGGVLSMNAGLTEVLSSIYNRGGDAALESVTIGTQTWTAKNLDVATYSNGDPIPQVTDATEWAALTTGAWCYSDNDPSNYSTYGKLYNWYAVNDPRGLAPEGWHVPTDAEWKTLEMELGMSQSEADDTGWRGTDEGSQLAGNAGLWTDGNLESNANFGTSGFSGLPGGFRSNNGTFYTIGYNAIWWSSSEYSTTLAWYRDLYYNTSDVYRGTNGKDYGFSVRCVRD